MATVSTSQNIGAITYAAAETITIDRGATLTIDAQVPADVSKLATLPGTITCITSGELKVINTSTSTPLVLTLSDFAKDLTFSKNGILRAEGAMIDLAVGTGAAQSWSFASAPLNTIPYPSYVEVEDSVGSNTYMPRPVFCTAGKSIVYAKSLWGASGENGDVLFWDHTSRTLESGDGTNGRVIPAGCKVRIPNIYIHSATGNATQVSRSRIILSTGRFYASCVAFSDNIWYINGGAGDTELTRVGFVGDFNHNNTNSAFHATNVSLSADTQNNTSGNGWASGGLLGASSFERIFVTHSVTAVPSNGVCFSVNVALGCTKMDKITAMVRERATTTPASIEIYNVPVPSGVLRDLVAIGARAEIYDNSDLTFVNFRHTDKVSDTSSLVQVQQAVVIGRCKNVSFVNIGKAGKAAARSGIMSADSQSEGIRIFGGSYDCDNNTITGLFTGNGKLLEVRNLVLTNVPAGAVISDSPSTFLSSQGGFYNVRGVLAGAGSNDALCNGVYDGLVGTVANFATGFAGGVDFNSAHLLDSGLNPTSGSIVFSSFGNGARNVFQNSGQMNQSGQIELPVSGDSVVCESLAFHGITGLASSAPLFSYTEGGVVSVLTTTPPTNMTVEFALATSEGDYGAWAAMTGANLASEITALSGYSSTDGLRVKMRVTATTTDATRLFTAAAFATVFDSAYRSDDATINIDGMDVTDVTTMYRLSDDSVVTTFTGSGWHSFAAADDYLADVYFVRRTAAGIEKMRTQSTPVPLVLGDNGNLNLFAGDEVQIVEAPLIDSIDDTLVALNAYIRAFVDVAVSTRTAPNDLATINAKIDAETVLVDEIHKIHGLGVGVPLVVSATSRIAGVVSQTISGADGTVSVTRV